MQIYFKTPHAFLIKGFFYYILILYHVLKKTTVYDAKEVIFHKRMSNVLLAFLGAFTVILNVMSNELFGYGSVQDDAI